jgi:hypothetical protein
MLDEVTTLTIMPKKRTFRHNEEIWKLISEQQQAW